MELPPRVGIMCLPHAILFPQTLLPLHIFEPRYRKMLAGVLEDQRMFAVALTDKDMKPRSVGGVGVVRACVENSDGTSNLVLQGVARVRFSKFVQTEPHYIAEIESIHAEATSDKRTRIVALQVLRAVDRIRSQYKEVPEWMRKFLGDLQDLDTLADLVACTFIQDLFTQQAILEELDLHTRLCLVREALRAQLSGPPL